MLRDGRSVAHSDSIIPGGDFIRHPDSSAGFDSRIGDPLGKFALTDNNFAELTKLMKQAAADHCKGRLVSVLLGGFNLDGLASAMKAHVGAML